MLWNLKQPLEIYDEEEGTWFKGEVINILDTSVVVTYNMDDIRVTALLDGKSDYLRKVNEND